MYTKTEGDEKVVDGEHQDRGERGCGINLIFFKKIKIGANKIMIHGEREERDDQINFFKNKKYGAN